MPTTHEGPHVWLFSRQFRDYYCRYCLVIRALCGTANCEETRC
jgi:hypothetical protein